LLTITLEDLRFRFRQFLIAVMGAALVFAMTLLLAGLAAGFGVEIDKTVNAIGAQSWVLASGASGRMASMPPILQTAVSAVSQEPGVIRSDPIVVSGQTATVGSSPEQSIILFGVQRGGLGSPRPLVGRAIQDRGEAVVDSSLGARLGQSFTVAGHRLRVVGTVNERTLFGGNPGVYVTVPTAQNILFGGRHLISAVLTTGVPRALPPGYAVLTNTQIEAATLQQLASAKSSIDSSRFFMWLIAAIIVAGLIYVSALERTRDFAVLKALGSSSGLLFVGLAAQAVAVALAAAIIAALIANFMTGLFAQPVDIPVSAFVVLPLSAIAVGLIASLAALRRAVSVDPATAFAGR